MIQSMPKETFFDTFDSQGFAGAIASWYKQAGRDLPWRRTCDPYAIWISEIMLQQTQVDTVKPYYERFMEHFPTVDKLAQAPMDDIYKLWEGLGYYRRAAHLKEAAITVAGEYSGHFPETFEEIIKLKGIGSYTASAIASIAFKQPKGVIDGNTLRIISRVFDRQDNIAKDATKKLYQTVMDHLIAYTDPSDFNQGMMDLGATICTPRKPDCGQCPVMAFCQAYHHKTAGLLPVNIKNKNKTDIYLITAVLRCQDKYFLIKNKDGLLTGLYGLAQYEVESPMGFEDQFYESYRTSVRLLEYEKEFRHIFSHRVWHMSVYYGEIQDSQSPLIKENLYTWEELTKLPIPTAHKKIIQETAGAARLL